MNTNEDILAKAVNDLKNRTKESTVPQSVLERTASWLGVSQRSRTVFTKSIFSPSLAAAIVLIAALAIIYVVSDKFNNDSVAWAQVKEQFQKINFVHSYSVHSNLSTRGDGAEAWYIDGVIYLKENGKITKDNGITEMTYDFSGKFLSQKPSEMNGIMLNKDASLFDVLTQGILEYRSQEISAANPSYIGEDLLIYKFNAPESMKDWVSTITITVGRNSKLPVYMKMYRDTPQSEEFEIYIFDYELYDLPEIIKTILAK